MSFQASGELLPLGVEIDGGKVRRMMLGSAVRISHHHLGTAGTKAHTMWVTHEQHRGAGVAMHRGKHLTMRMSPQQVAYNVKYGSGIFSNIYNKIKAAVPAVYSAAKNFVNNHPVGQALKTAAVGAAKNYAGQALDKAQSYATAKVPQAASLISGARSAIDNKLSQVGGKVRKSRKHSKASSGRSVASRYRLFGDTDEIEHNLGIKQ